MVSCRLIWVMWWGYGERIREFGVVEGGEGRKDLKMCFFNFKNEVIERVLGVGIIVRGRSGLSMLVIIVCGKILSCKFEGVRVYILVIGLG